MARIDLGEDDSQDELAEALRQLERAQQRRPEQTEGPAAEGPAAEEEAAKRQAQEEREAEHERSREEIEGAVEALRERQVAERAPGRAAPSRAPWIALGVVVVGAITAGFILLRPKPLPPPAATPRAAVEGFWEAIAQGHYQGATVYYPALIDRYGSRRQAALYLEQHFGDDPPMKVTVGEPEELPDSADLRVSYEVWRRSGRPRTGECIVRDSGSEETGYVILTGP